MRSVLPRGVVVVALAAGPALAQPDPTTGTPPTEPASDPTTEPTAPTSGEATAPPPPTTSPTMSGNDRPAVRGNVEPSRQPPSIDPAVAPTTEPASRDRGFRFGSYGRLVAGTDLRGGKPESANVVAFGPRIVEPSYLELDLSYGFTTPSGRRLRPVITLAFDGTLFHETGDFDAQPALRNLFLDAEVSSNLTAWIGSRMYRGDDIYLFSYWPLDDQNTVGGGLIYRADSLELAVHGGANRLNRPFNYQQIDVPDPEQGATTVTQLNRQRLVGSTTASYILRDAVGSNSIKLKGHGEVHAIASGTRRRTDGTFEQLPADTGFLVGAEIGMFGETGDERNATPITYRRHLNGFARYSKGLAAFDELAPPSSFGNDLTTGRANELSFGLSGNYDHAIGNVLVGALSRRFIDADAPGADPDDGWEYAVNVRPLARVVPDVFVGADLSYQARFPKGLNPISQRAEDPAVFQVAPMLVFSPMGPSAYDRPQLRVVYRAAHFNSAALDLFVPDDPRHGRTWTHFLGVQAEWWFNSSTYR